MVAFLFLLVAAAMAAAMLGRRNVSLVIFALGLCLALGWLNHHATSTLALEF